MKLKLISLVYVWVKCRELLNKLENLFNIHEIQKKNEWDRHLLNFISMKLFYSLLYINELLRKTSFLFSFFFYCPLMKSVLQINLSTEQVPILSRSITWLPKFIPKDKGSPLVGQILFYIILIITHNLKRCMFLWEKNRINSIAKKYFVRVRRARKRVR